MTVDVRINHESMRKMAAAFKAAARTLDNSASTLGAIQKMLENDGLRGEAGDELFNSLQGRLIPRLNALRDKMAELEQDIHKAAQASRDSEGEARQRFNN